MVFKTQQGEEEEDDDEERKKERNERKKRKARKQEAMRKQRGQITLIALTAHKDDDIYVTFMFTWRVSLVRCPAGSCMLLLLSLCPLVVIDVRVPVRRIWTLLFSNCGLSIID